MVTKHSKGKAAPRKGSPMTVIKQGAAKGKTKRFGAASGNDPNQVRGQAMNRWVAGTAPIEDGAAMLKRNKRLKARKALPHAKAKRG